ncbi:MAG TPA: hybrid sensor histidine kinase/response regulator [Gemmatimonadaceae bacterium]|nr:hybrid sensor histidine kinase/response regulator [Gemmatimonadaceae bacterium]
MLVDGPSDSLIALLVEDNLADAALIAHSLAPSGDAPSSDYVRLVHVTSANAATAVLRDSRVRIVILDPSLPDALGLEALHRIRDVAPTIPVIVLTGASSESVALEALRAGAQDYVFKPPPDGATMQRILHYALQRQQLLQERDAAARASAMAARQWRVLAEARDRTMSIVSHDLGNSLTTIEICAEALLDPTPPPENGVRTMAELIQRSVKGMRRIASDLLDKSSVDAGLLTLDRRPTNVPELLRSTHAMFTPEANERAVTIIVEKDDDLPPIDVDPDRLMQILSNLIGNALKFTPEGGRVVLAAQLVADNGSDSMIDPSESGGGGELVDHVRFSVSDTGPGIRAEDLEHVFDWFWHAPNPDHGGQGFGLAIAKDLVEAHRQSLHVQSTIGQGSTFWFSMPVVPSA